MALQFLTRTRARRWCARSPIGCCPRTASSPAGARRAPPTTSTARSARSRSTRRGSGPADRTRVASAATPASTQFLPLSRVEELAWRTRIEGSRGIAEREWNGPVRGWQEIYRDGHRGTRRRLPRPRRRAAGRRARRGPRAQAAAVRARVRGLLRRAGVRRQPRPRRLAGDRVRGRRATARLERRRGHRCLTSTWSSSARARVARPRPTCSPRRGKSVCMLEKGRNHLLALEPPFASLGHLSNDEIKFDRRHFLGPDPLLEPRTYRRTVADGERTGHRRRQQHAVDRRRRGLPRRRQAAALPRGRLPSRAASSARSTAPTSPTGRSTTTRWSRTTRRPSAHRRRRRPHRQSVRGVAQRARTRCRRAPTCSSPRSPVPAAEAARLPPVPRADGRQQRRRTTVARRATTAGSARSTGARSRRRATRSAMLRRRAAHRPLRDPARERRASRSSSTAPGSRARGVRYLDARRRVARGVTATRSSSRAARSRRPGSCCAAASATRPISSAAT